MLRETYFAVTTRRCRRLLTPQLLIVVVIALVTVASVALFYRVAEPGQEKRDVAGHPGGTFMAPATVAPVAKASDLQEDDHEAVDAPAVGAQVAESQLPPRKPPSLKLHPEYQRLIREYPFQPCRTDRGQFVNIIFVRSPFRSRAQEEMYEKYKDEILFLGISSFEDFPLPPPNPYSAKFPEDKYVGLFPGFLHMMREPEKFFPPHVKLLLMSQSDFALPYPRRSGDKLYDFVYSGSDQDVHNDCEGWSSFAKNWTFVKQALEIMCGEYGMTGVLVATKDKQDRKACTIPSACHGKVLQTKYLPQNEFFDYMRQSRWAFLPQVHDASPRVTTQALMHDLPMLMNWHIAGGWKYLTEKTGEFFHDLSDFRPALERIRDGTRSQPSRYEPKKWVSQNYGDSVSGPRLKAWVVQNFADRVALPAGTRSLLPSGA